MNANLKELARELAAQPYTIAIEETTDDGPAFVMSHPELPGCMSHGFNLQDAKANLADARFEYILSLLEDGLPVPAPSEDVSPTTGTGVGISPGLST